MESTGRKLSATCAAYGQLSTLLRLFCFSNLLLLALTKLQIEYVYFFLSPIWREMCGARRERLLPRLPIEFQAASDISDSHDKNASFSFSRLHLEETFLVPQIVIKKLHRRFSRKETRFFKISNHEI